jgi:hypothetical protein
VTAVGTALEHDQDRGSEPCGDVCRRSRPRGARARLGAQLEARFPEHREPEADARMHPAARLGTMLRRVSENELKPRGERLVVLIDGLDEYDPPAGTPGRDPLAAFLLARCRAA